MEKKRKKRKKTVQQIYSQRISGRFKGKVNDYSRIRHIPNKKVEKTLKNRQTVRKTHSKATIEFRRVQIFNYFLCHTSSRGKK